MSIVAIVIVILGIWLAFKAVGMIVRLLIWTVVLGAIYWLAAPYLGLPMPG